MKTSITKGLSEQEASEIKVEFVRAAHLRKRIIKLLEEKYDSERKNSLTKERYESPSWAYIQADAVGYERALREVISLLE